MQHQAVGKVQVRANLDRLRCSTSAELLQPSALLAEPDLPPSHPVPVCSPSRLGLSIHAHAVFSLSFFLCSPSRIWWTWETTWCCTSTTSGWCRVRACCILICCALPADSSRLVSGEPGVCVG